MKVETRKKNRNTSLDDLFENEFDDEVEDDFLSGSVDTDMVIDSLFDGQDEDDEVSIEDFFGETGIISEEDDIPDDRLPAISEDVFDNILECAGDDTVASAEDHATIEADEPARNDNEDIKPAQKKKNTSPKKATPTTDKKKETKKKPDAISEPENEEEAIQEPDENIDSSTTEDIEVPNWVVSMRAKLLSSVAHAFILEGNVRDYMIRNISINDGIVLTLDPQQDNYDVIACYDQAHNLTFFQSDIIGNVSYLEYKERFIEMMNAAQLRLNLEQTEEPPTDPVLLFSIIAEIFEHPSDTRNGKMLLFVEYPDLLVPESASMQMKDSERKLSIIISDMCRSQMADEAGNCIIFKTDDISQLSSRIRSTSSRVDRITVPEPLLAERRDFIENVLDIPENCLSDGRQIFECIEGVNKEYLAVNTAGLACYQIEDIVLRALSDDEPITKELVKDRKNEIIKIDYDDVIDIMEPVSGFSGLGGMEQIKAFFRDEVIDPIHRGELEAVSMGVLMMGPPGTGKTALAKAVAYESGMNCVNLNLNRIMDKYVGQSERNLDRALDCAMAMQPTIIFIDEIDEALPKRNSAEQSSVNQRINKRLLEFFSDTTHRGQVMILAATNYPEKIDPAFKRAGRFDKRIPLFGPDRFDRMRILKIIARGKGYQVSCILDPDKKIANPFVNIKSWIESGHRPHNEGAVGAQSEYVYTASDPFGNVGTYRVILPDAVIALITEPKISLSRFYRGIELVLEGILAPKQSNTASGDVESDEKYFARIESTIASQPEIFGEDPKNLAKVCMYLKLWDKVLRPFHDQTDYMTGAELDVVVAKAITLLRKFKIEHADKYSHWLQQGYIKDERDIPWEILYDACRKTTNATAGIKLMEDNALINTSDLDFIPDAKYGVTDDGREVSYRERQDELVNRLQHAEG